MNLSYWNQSLAHFVLIQINFAVTIYQQKPKYKVGILDLKLILLLVLSNYLVFLHLTRMTIEGFAIVLVLDIMVYWHIGILAYWSFKYQHMVYCFFDLDISRFGRQRTFFLTSIALSIFAFATGFASSIEVYVFLRFVVAATNATVFLIGYVYCKF